MSKFLNFDIFLSLKIVFILAYSADPDVMLQYAAFQLGHYCLPKYLFAGIQNETVNIQFWHKFPDHSLSQRADQKVSV